MIKKGLKGTVHEVTRAASSSSISMSCRSNNSNRGSTRCEYSSSTRRYECSSNNKSKWTATAAAGGAEAVATAEAPSGKSIENLYGLYEQKLRKHHERQKRKQQLGQHKMYMLQHLQEQYVMQKVQ